MFNPHMLRLFSVLIFLSFQAFQASGQQQSIDSLSNALRNSSDKTQKTDILNELAFSYFDYNSEKGLEYASQAYDLASEIKYLKGLRRALTLKGFYFYATG